MSSRLYFGLVKEFENAQEELRVAREAFKKCNNAENVIAVEVAKCKVAQWNRAINLLYLKG